MIHLMKNYEDEKEDPQSQSKVPNAKFVLAVNKLRNRSDLESLLMSGDKTQCFPTLSSLHWHVFAQNGFLRKKRRERVKFVDPPKEMLLSFSIVWFD